jgi:hypothetical protein
LGLLDGFLTQLSTGDQVKDFSHASKLFHDGDQKTTGNALYPKMGYMYHVYFDIDTDLKQSGSVPDAATEVGMLVKSIDLPKFTIDNKTLNSYGRPSIVQTKIHYDQVTFQFHDDSADRVRTLWADYYAYYYRDMDGGVGRGGEIDPSYIGANGRYENDRKNVYGFTPLTQVAKPKNFIRSIKIYSLHQKRFSEYILVNPIITSFKHGQHSSSSTEPMQHEMTVSYEFVLYADGYVKPSTMPSFAKLHYDKKPSPLTPANGTQSIMGPGGLMDTADDVINSIPNDPLGAAFKAFRGISNAGKMNLKEAAMGELTQFGMDVLSGNNPLNRIAVPSFGDIANKIQGNPTDIDNQSAATSRGGASSNGASSNIGAVALSAGVALLASGSPKTVAGIGIAYAAGKALFSKSPTPAQTSTPPAPSTSDTHP